MLNVYFGKDWKSVIEPDGYFKYSYDEKWFDDDIVKQMVKDIDNSDVLDEACIRSPYLGLIPPTDLSGSVKTLIMIYKGSEHPFDLICCGENCEKWLAWLGSNVDRDVTVSGFDLIFRGYDLNFRCENDGSLIKNSQDWVYCCQKYIMSSERNVTDVSYLADRSR